MKTTGYSRVSKDIIIREIEKELKAKPTFFVTQHGGVSAVAIDKLRSKLRGVNSRYMVVKKSLSRKALERVNLKQLGENMDGACGIAFTAGDVVASSKVLVEFAKENEAFKIHQGYMNGQAMAADQVKILATLPSREVLLSKLLGGMQAPVSRFVGVLSGTLRQVVTVLDAIAKKKQ